MQRSISILALALFPAVAGAQASATKTVPASAATTEGNSSSYFPFIYDKGRFQHLIDGKALARATAVIQQFAYRRDGTSRSTFAGRTIQTFKVTIGYTKNSAATMSKTFASNRSGTQTVVLNGNYNLPNQPPVQGLGPWNVFWKLARPFVYTVAQGNLLLEYEIPGRAGRKAEYFLDSHAVGLPGTYRVYGTPGPFASGDRHWLYSNSANLRPGGSADIRVTGLKKAYPAVAVYGFSDKRYGALRLPFHLNVLGATNNYLYASIDLALAMPLRQVGTLYQGLFQLPIPNAAGVGGITLYGTAIYVDPPSNRLNLVFSRGAAMTIASTGAGPMQILGQSDSSQATGFFLARSGTNAPVIEFTGAIN